MRRLLSIALALAATSCSLLFEPSQYTDGRDASQSGRDASMDASRDAGETSMDAGTPADAGDASSAPDTGNPDGGGGTPGAWPACGDGTRQSSGATDRSGAPVTISDAFHQALFGGGVAGDGEVGLEGDLELPRPSTGRFVDVAIAPRAAGGAYVAGATDLGDLRVHTVDLTDGVQRSPEPLAVTWFASEAPDSIERISMRTIDGATVLGVVGTTSADPLARGWRCTIASDAVACSERFSQDSAGQLATVAVSASSSGGSDVLFLGPAHALQASAGTVRSHSVAALGARVGGTDGPLVHTLAGSGSPFGLWISSAGIVPYRIGPATAAIGGVAFVDPHFLSVRALGDTPLGFDLGARVVQVSSSECTCPAADGASCMNDSGFSSMRVDGLDALFVEAERAGGAVLAVVGAREAGVSTRGTDVRLYAFEAISGAPIVTPGIVLGSGRAGSPPIGTLVADFGMRAAVVPNGAGFDILEAALIDLNEGGSTSRRIYVSALRICQSP